MFSRQHLEQIRRRRSEKHTRRRLNSTISLDKPLRFLNENHSLDCSSSVAKHLRQIGQRCYYNPRISLPLQPTGGKLSKIVHRKPFHDSPVESIGSPTTTLVKQTTRSQSHERAIRCKPMESKSTNDGIKTHANLDWEECHSLYLPNWLVDRLRPAWSTFEKPPPPLTSQAAEQADASNYTFKRVMERLRKAKMEANIDLDEMFSNLGLDTTELALSAPSKRVEHHTIPSREENKINNETKELSLRKISKEPRRSHSPLRKRIRHVWNELDSQLPIPTNCELFHDRALQRMAEKREVRATRMSRTRSSSSDSPSCANEIQILKPTQGLDVLALGLYDSFTKSDSSPFRYVPTFSRNDRRDQVSIIKDQRRPKSPEPPLDKKLKNTFNRSNDLGYSGHALAKSMKQPDRLNLSLQEEPQFRRRANLNLTFSGQDNLWISPIEPSSKSVRFNVNPTRITVTQTPSIMAAKEQKDQLVPMHPLWDTPDELKTSHFATFHI